MNFPEIKLVRKNTDRGRQTVVKAFSEFITTENLQQAKFLDLSII